MFFDEMKKREEFRKKKFGNVVGGADFIVVENENEEEDQEEDYDDFDLDLDLDLSMFGY